MYEPARNGRGSYIYRLYSGYAHGKQWALAQGAQAAGPADASGTTLASIRADLPRAGVDDSAGRERDGEGGERLHCTAVPS